MILFLAHGVNAATPITIGNDAALPLLSGLNYRGTIGDRPDDGASEALNPPIFHWIYTEQPWVEADWFDSDFSRGHDTVRTFRFQLTTNGNFSNLYWDIATSNNFYNTLPPITNANGTAWLGSNWWRIIYMNANATSNRATSVVHHFKLSNTASNWNRAMLADTNYLYAKLGSHPGMFFEPSNATAALTYMNTGYVGNSSWDWQRISNNAISHLSEPRWTNEALTVSQGGYDTYYWLTEAALTYVVDSNALISAKDPGEMMSINAKRWLSDPFFFQFHAYEHDAPVLYSMPIAYDAFYNISSPTQRSNMLYCMEKIVCWYMSTWWFTGGHAGAAGSNTFDYATATAQPEGAGKQGFSHSRVDGHAMLLMCMAGYTDSALLREMFPYALNYTITKKDPSDWNDGRGYSGFSFGINPEKEGIAEMVSIWKFPEAQLQRNPVYQEFISIAAYLEPHRYKANGQAWGDYGYGMGWTQPLSFQDERWHWWSRVLNHGALYKQWVDYGGNSPTTGQPFMAALSYYFRPPAQSNWAENSYIDQHRGFAFLNSRQPNDTQAFSNSVGLIIGASPGVTSDHRSAGLHGGTEMWAYGARVSAHGSGPSKHPQAQWGMTFVDGFGPYTRRGWNITNIQSRFTSWTNSDDFGYVASDTVGAYNRLNVLNDEIVFNRYGTNHQPYLSSMKRNNLFPHKKYLVMYDTMTSTTNATFQKLFHAMEPNGWMNPTNLSFNYTLTNHSFSGSYERAQTVDLGGTNVSLTTFYNPTNRLVPVFWTSISTNIVSTNYPKVTDADGLVLETNLVASRFYTETWTHIPEWYESGDFASSNNATPFTQTVYPAPALPRNNIFNTTNWQITITWRSYATNDSSNTNAPLIVDQFGNRFLTNSLSTSLLGTNVYIVESTMVSPLTGWTNASSITSTHSPAHITSIRATKAYIATNTNYVVTAEYLMPATSRTNETLTVHCSTTMSRTISFARNPVRVHVVPFVSSSLLGFTNTPGRINYYVNPFTGEQPYYTTDIEEWPYEHVWYYNKTPTTNWHFGFVVYPQRWDEPAPTITRLDDFTVKVQGYTNDGSAYPGNWVPFTETNTFDTNYASAYTFMVDAGAQFQNTPDTNAPSAISGFTATPGDTQISLSWSQNDHPVDAYYLKRTNDSTVIVVSGSASSYVNTSLANGTLYGYLLWPSNAYGTNVMVYAGATPASGGGGSPGVFVQQAVIRGVMIR